MKKTQWNNRQGSRDRQAVCLLITAKGEAHRFSGESIPGVCASVEMAYSKAGKWSHSTYEITHSETTAVVSWMQDWDLGHSFPQISWEAGYLWLAETAPLLTREGFEKYIRAHLPKTAARWDKTAEAEKEFGFPATEEEAEKIRIAMERVAAEKAAYETDQKAKRANSPFAKLAGLKF